MRQLLQKLQKQGFAGETPEIRMFQVASIRLPDLFLQNEVQIYVEIAHTENALRQSRAGEETYFQALL